MKQLQDKLYKLRDDFINEKREELIARQVPKDITEKRVLKKWRRFCQLFRCEIYNRKQRWWAKWQERVKANP